MKRAISSPTRSFSAARCRCLIQCLALEKTVHGVPRWTKATLPDLIQERTVSWVLLLRKSKRAPSLSSTGVRVALLKALTAEVNRPVPAKSSRNIPLEGIEGVVLLCTSPLLPGLSSLAQWSSKAVRLVPLKLFPPCCNFKANCCEADISTVFSDSVCKGLPLLSKTFEATPLSQDLFLFFLSKARLSLSAGFLLVSMWRSRQRTPQAEA